MRTNNDEANVGERLWIVRLRSEEATVRRLMGMGLAPGCEVKIKPHY